MPWQHSAFLTDFTALNGLLCYIAPEISILISSHIFIVFEFQGHPWLTVTGEFKQEFILVKQELAVGRMIVCGHFVHDKRKMFTFSAVSI